MYYTYVIEYALHIWHLEWYDTLPKPTTTYIDT